MTNNKQHLITGNVLYFEGAGMDFYDSEQTNNSNVGNFRIRTAFKNNEGIEYYIELGNTYKRDKKGKQNGEMGIHIDFAFNIEEMKEHEEKNGTGFKYSVNYDREKLKQLNYTKQDITKWINENLNCSFDTIQVLDTFYGYRVHGENGTTNLMENIDLNHKRAAKRKEVYNNLDQEYRALTGDKYSVISLLEMNDTSITVRCHASNERLKGAERVKTVSTI